MKKKLFKALSACLLAAVLLVGVGQTTFVSASTLHAYIDPPGN